MSYNKIFDLYYKFQILQLKIDKSLKNDAKRLRNKYRVYLAFHSDKNTIFLMDNNMFDVSKIILLSFKKMCKAKKIIYEET